MTISVTPPIRVRLARPEDADAIHAITAAAYAEYRDADIPSSALAETAATVRADLEREGQGAALVEQDGWPVGCVRFRAGADDLYFFRLAVLPECQGRGLAKSLLLWLSGFAAGAGKERLWCLTRVSVSRNRHLYRSHGFTEGEERTTVNPLGAPVRVVTMTKDVDFAGQARQETA